MKLNLKFELKSSCSNHQVTNHNVENIWKPRKQKFEVVLKQKFENK